MKRSIIGALLVVLVVGLAVGVSVPRDMLPVVSTVVASEPVIPTLMVAPRDRCVESVWSSGESVRVESVVRAFSNGLGGILVYRSGSLVGILPPYTGQSGAMGLRLEAGDYAIQRQQKGGTPVPGDLPVLLCPDVTGR